MSKIFYFFLFNAMVKHIVESKDFVDWCIEEEVSWQHPVESRRMNNQEMVQLYLSTLGKMRDPKEMRK